MKMKLLELGLTLMNLRRIIVLSLLSVKMFLEMIVHIANLKITVLID